MYALGRLRLRDTLHQFPTSLEHAVCALCLSAQAARAMYALGRLRLRDDALCEVVVAATFDRLSLLPAEGLSALAAGFGGLGYAPPR